MNQPANADEATTVAIDEVETVTADEAATLRDNGALVIDVRSEATRNVRGVVPGAVVVDRTRLAELFGTDSAVRLPELSGVQDQPIVVYCGSNNGSTPVVQWLADNGFDGAVQVDGGFSAWQEAGHPVLPPVS